MSELSQNTKNLVHTLYLSSEAIEVCDILKNQCSAEALSCHGWSPVEMERIQYAVLRLTKEKKMPLDSAVELAQKDWRDLLVIAGFSNDLNAHKDWAEQNS